MNQSIQTTAFLERLNSPISAGRRHYGVIDEKGLLYMAGRNKNGRLGFISDQKEFTIPVLVQVGPVGTKVVSVSCSNSSTVVVTDDGQVYGTGNVDLNLDGQIQNIKTFQKMNIAEKVWKVSHSVNHYIFLLRNGSVRMNGVFEINLEGGYLPEYKKIHVSSLINIKAVDVTVMAGLVTIPIDLSTQVYPVARYAIIDVEGNLYYFGTWFGPKKPDLDEEKQNQAYDAGEIDMITFYRGLIFEGFSNRINRVTIQPMKIVIPEQVKQVALGLDHILILTSLGNVYTMGENYDGQLGIPYEDHRLLNKGLSLTFEDPYKIRPLAMKISSISAGEYTSAAISKNGQLYIWGRNTNNIIPNIVSQLEAIEKYNYFHHFHRTNGYTGEINILKPVPILLDISGHPDDVNMDKYSIIYVSIGTYFGIAVAKDGGVDFFKSTWW